MLYFLWYYPCKGGDYRVTINDRIKRIRKEMHLTQIDFGDKIAVSQGHLTAMENSKREVTEKTIKVICLEFNVNEQWLRTGKGEMFIESDNTLLDAMVTEYGLNNRQKAALAALLKMSDEQREAILDGICTIANSIAEVNESAATTYGDIDAEVEAYRQELIAEKKGQSVLQNIETRKKA